MNVRVRLNVGGYHFETTRGTLTSCPESLLARMFDPDSELPPAALTEDGAYFIDACPRAFEVILNWLRYKEVMLGMEAVARDVLTVADYFGLNELCENLKRGEKQITADAYDTIRLKVWEKNGGNSRILETTRASLTSIPGSQLAQMFSPDSEEILQRIIQFSYHFDFQITT